LLAVLAAVVLALAVAVVGEPVDSRLIQDLQSHLL
jgi:hypothetical protein